MATAVSAGSNPLPSSPSFFSPTRWNSWTVDIACGVLTAVVLYFIWKIAQASTQAPPKQGSSFTALFLANQHPINIPQSDEAITCINEIAPLPFEKFAEGIIHLDMDKTEEYFTRHLVSRRSAALNNLVSYDLNL